MTQAADRVEAAPKIEVSDGVNEFESLVQQAAVKNKTEITKVSDGLYRIQDKTVCIR
jgi:hypothetical protein